MTYLEVYGMVKRAGDTWKDQQEQLRRQQERTRSPYIHALTQVDTGQNSFIHDPSMFKDRVSYDTKSRNPQGAQLIRLRNRQAQSNASFIANHLPLRKSILSYIFGSPSTDWNKRQLLGQKITQMLKDQGASNNAFFKAHGTLEGAPMLHTTDKAKEKQFKQLSPKQQKAYEQAARIQASNNSNRFSDVG